MTETPLKAAAELANKLMHGVRPATTVKVLVEGTAVSLTSHPLRYGLLVEMIRKELLAQKNRRARLV